MSSTYVHYSTPSSLPSDYALLSRYAAAHGNELDANSSQNVDNNLDGHDSNVINDDESSLLPEDQSLISGRKPRRTSFPTSYVTPFNPTSMVALPDKTGHRSGPIVPDTATEHTPLLAPLVPRIEEDVDHEDDSSTLGAHPNLFLEEARILAKYTLPVFG